jgi:hypothetical protein
VLVVNCLAALLLTCDATTSADDRHVPANAFATSHSVVLDIRCIAGMT